MITRYISEDNDVNNLNYNSSNSVNWLQKGKTALELCKDEATRIALQVCDIVDDMSLISCIFNILMLMYRRLLMLAQVTLF